MRVIAGSLGGRRLKAPRGRATRPTSDRVKEALFAMLGPIEDTRVMDLFAGSGALGIEALSRGALLAVFVERDARATRALGENLAQAGPGTSAWAIEDAWMSSAPHRANILNGGFNRIGVGVTVDGAGRVWMVALFGAR